MNQRERVPIQSWRSLGIMLAAQVGVAYLGRGLAPLGPLIEADFAISKAQVGMLPAALFLGQALFNLPAGFLADRFGSRKMLLTLCLSAAVCFHLAAWAPWFGLLLTCVILGGFVYGGMHPVTNRGVLYSFPPLHRGTAMGIKQTGVTAGSALSGLILLPAALTWGWREALAVSSIGVGVLGWVVFFLYRSTSEPTGERGGIRTFFLGVRRLGSHRSLWILSLATVGLNMGNLVLSTYIVFFAHEYLQYGLMLSGLSLVISEVSGSAGRIVWGMVSDRLLKGRRVVVLMIIASVTLFCSLAAAFLPRGIAIGWFIVLVVVFGFCISGFNGIWMNAATESVPQEQAGMASGFSVSIGSWGVVLGPPIFGWVVDHSGFSRAWLLLAGVMVVVLLCLMGIRGAEEDCKK